METYASGSPEETCFSYPFGDGLNCAGGADATEHHFTSKARDFESGNDYFKYRYLASSTGRWLSPDPSGLTYADLENPQELNAYSYVGNNPMTRIDLLGLCWKGFNWACNLYQRTRNWIERDGFRTDEEDALNPGKGTQRKRQESLMKERGMSKPCSVSTRVAQGIIGVANLGDALLRAQAIGPGTVALGEAPPAAAVFAVYGTVSVFGQALAGGSQVVEAVTGTSGAKATEQAGNILAGPAAGLTTFAMTKDGKKAETNANRESFANAGVGLVKRSSPALIRGGEFALGAVGLGSVGCNLTP